MLNNIKQIQKFVKAGIKDVYTEFNFYQQQKITIPQFNRGIFGGKITAYEKVLEFIYELENSRRRANDVR